MSSTAAAPRSPAAPLRLPRVSQAAFLRLFLSGLRGDFAPWRDAVRRYPQGIETRIVRQRCILMNEPDGIEEILVRNHKYYHRRTRSTPLKVYTGQSVLTLSGDAHLRQRRLIQPAFHKSRIDAYGDAMAAIGEGFASRWRDGIMVDIHQEMMEVTAAIITKTMFSSDIEEDVRIVGHAIDFLLSHAGRYVIPMLGNVLDRMPLKSTRRIKESLAQLDSVIYRIIRDHRAAGDASDDVLSMLMAAQYDDGSTMTDRQLRDESMTLFLAGHETISNALSWTFYLLSRHPEIAERLREEVDSVLDNGRTPNVDDIPRLDYVRRVLTESMRLYPPVPGVDREAVASNEILGIDINAGDLLLISPLITHYDPRWYPEPERFDPDRWLPERAESVPRYAYLPFGGGARRCIGERFAWMEGILLLAIFSRDWHFELAPDARVRTQLNITLRPIHGVQMVLRGRRNGERRRIRGHT
ncbi:MAG: cytochrome P450 [Candidatus Hydrogenedentes bacterium]|nr:cytochrome P450 [Candidatus Hydrogenedentota bacterium]